MTIADYFSMMEADIAGEPYSKTAHRLQLLPKLDGRTESAIEFKHQNISAVLHDLSLHFIKGYQPRGNYQNLLGERIQIYLAQHPELLQKIVDAPVELPQHIDYSQLIVPPPVTQDETVSVVNEGSHTYRRPYKIDFLERDRQNRDLGRAGERLVLKYERWYLTREGRSDLAALVKHVSETDDGAGYDILSYTLDGHEKYIEVKATRGNKEIPFFCSRNEYDCSKLYADRYYLYRVFNIEQDPHFFVLKGSFDLYCYLEPAHYKVFLRSDDAQAGYTLDI